MGLFLSVVIGTRFRASVVGTRRPPLPVVMRPGSGGASPYRLLPGSAGAHPY
jgi:hypothetical protein